jgi:hypothetical protein
MRWFWKKRKPKATTLPGLWNYTNGDATGFLICRKCGKTIPMVPTWTMQYPPHMHTINGRETEFVLEYYKFHPKPKQVLVEEKE